MAVDRREAVHAVVRAEAPHGAGGGEQAGHAPPSCSRRPRSARRRRPPRYTVTGVCPVLGGSVAELARTRSRPSTSPPPDVVTAQVWLNPAEIDVDAAQAATRRRDACAVVVVPSPSSPVALLPQHLTVPPVSSAQVWSKPGRDLATPPESPVTATGFKRSRVRAVADLAVLVVAPALDAAGRSVTAHVWSQPAEICCDAAGAARRRRRASCACCACHRRAGRCRCSPSTERRRRSVSAQPESKPSEICCDAAVSGRLTPTGSSRLISVPVTELAVAVVAPALDAAAVRQRRRSGPTRPGRPGRRSTSP